TLFRSASESIADEARRNRRRRAIGRTRRSVPLTFAAPSGIHLGVSDSLVEIARGQRTARGVERRAIRRAEVTETEWSDWRWQLRHRLETLADLEAFVELTDEERRGIAIAPGLFRIGITPYYAELMDRAHPKCPVRMQVIPLGAEERVAAGEYVDPLGEDGLMPEGVSCIVHRYPDRVLFLALDRCAIYCRHCN